MGDALAVSLIQLRNFGLDDYVQLHPAGSIGKKLTLQIDDLMFAGDRLAVVNSNSNLKKVVFEITSKRFGATCVVDDQNKLVGIFTDGDLRRLLEKRQDFWEFRAKDLMAPNPIIVKTGTMATDVVNVMKIYAVNQIIVVNNEEHPIGMIHLHDLLKAGVV